MMANNNTLYKPDNTHGHSLEKLAEKKLSLGLNSKHIGIFILENSWIYGCRINQKTYPYKNIVTNGAF